MRHKGRRNIHFIAKHLGRFVRVVHAAFIAPNDEWPLNARARFKGIGFSQRNSVHMERFASVMQAAILANDHPAIVSVEPRVFAGVAFSRFFLPGLLDGSLAAGGLS